MAKAAADSDGDDQTSIIIFISLPSFLALAVLAAAASYLLLSRSPSPSPQILISKFMATRRPYGSPDADAHCIGPLGNEELVNIAEQVQSSNNTTPHMFCQRGCVRRQMKNSC